MDYIPEKYCLWNNKTEMGFQALGWGKVYENKDLYGKAYLKVLESLRKLMILGSNFNLSFDDVDLFLHTISAEDEGREAVEAIIEGREILRLEEKGIYKETEAMEFAMEKYLEEFIESNFHKIKFGANLELYQNEENTGRQFPTAIGNIDLLAIDREKKEFVVIELKKGRSSDVVIGQILRYMGWIKENLANDYNYNVRGIIILKEKDEKLEYALKLLPNVNLFKYNVSFSIEKIS